MVSPGDVVCGVYGAPDSAADFARVFGNAPAWHDHRVAFSAPEAESDSEPPPLHYDSDTGQLTLTRDRVGVRTLYHTRDASTGALWFSSRLAPLRRAPQVSGKLCLSALRDYLTCAFVPGTQTLWDGIFELRPATRLTLPDQKFTTWWEPQEVSTPDDQSLAEHAARLRVLLEQAVASDLPYSGDVAVYLSGGLDSSLVTALARRLFAGDVHTFAIHFGQNYPNELEFSRLVARHCGTRHHEIEITPRQVRQALPEAMQALDDPIGDPLTVPNLLLGRAARQVASVVLDGEGGDPCFGGPKNFPMLLHALYAPDENDLSARADAYFRSFQKCFDDLPRLLTPTVQEDLRHAPPAQDLLVPFLSDAAPMRSYLNRLMHLNVRMKGADQILTKVNNLTSWCELSGRSPLFDPEIVSAAFAIPPAYKLDGSNEKAVLKEAVQDLLPAEILTRPKSGMLVPVQRWFKNTELRRYAMKLLLGRGARIRPYLNQSVIREWFDYQGTPWSRCGVKIWLVLSLELWLRAQE